MIFFTVVDSENHVRDYAQILLSLEQGYSTLVTPVLTGNNVSGSPIEYSLADHCSLQYHGWEAPSIYFLCVSDWEP